MATFRAFLRTVCHGVMSRLETNDIARVCGNDDKHGRSSKGMVCQCFEMDFFLMLCCMHCTPILALQAITRLVQVDWDANSVERVSFWYKMSKYISITPVCRETRRRCEGTKIRKDGNDKIRPVYSEELADRGMSRDFAEWARNLFLEKCEDYIEYRMLGERDRVT